MYRSDDKKEGDQTTMMENQNVTEKSVSSDSNASDTVLDLPIKDYVMDTPDLSSTRSLLLDVKK